MNLLVMRRPTLENLPPAPTLPPGYTLREWRESDVDALSRLMQSAFDNAEWTPEKLRATLLNSPDVKKTYVIDQSDVPVATASACLLEDRFAGSGYINFVATDAAHRGQGLGYAVTLAALQELARLGCKDVVLETEDARLDAIKIYQELGFEPEHSHESHPERWGEIFANLLNAINL